MWAYLHRLDPLAWTSLKGVAGYPFTSHLPLHMLSQDGVYLQRLPRKVGGAFLAAANRGEVS